MPVNFAERRKQAEDAGMISEGGGFYKFKEGDNRLRLLSECLPHQSEFQGKKQFKWLCYVLDRRDAKVKPFFMPHKIYKAIEALQTSEDYAFYDVPMPYDVTVHAKKAGTIDVEYAVVPARREIPLTAAELEEYDKAKPLEEIKQALRDKQQQKKTQTQQAARPTVEPDPEEQGAEHPEGCSCEVCIPF